MPVSSVAAARGTAKMFLAACLALCPFVASAGAPGEDPTDDAGNTEPPEAPPALDEEATPPLPVVVCAAVPEAASLTNPDGAATTPAPSLVELDHGRCPPGNQIQAEHGARLGGRLLLLVQGLEKAMEDAGGCENLVLFLDGEPMVGLHPSRCDKDNGHVGFRLTRTPESADAWRAILGHPVTFTKMLHVTIGSSTSRSYPRLNTDGVQVKLIQIPEHEFYVFLVIAAITVTLLLVLGRTTAMLRDPIGVGETDQHQRPYSLSRVQQAVWVVLSVLGYLFVWLITGELDSLSSSVLALIGISSGTALAAESIGSAQLRRLIAKEKKLREQVMRLYSARGSLEGTAHTDAERRTADEAVRTQEEALESVRANIRARQTGGFFTDIVSDPTGVSLQRAQIAVWTLVLGVIFLYEVYDRLTMPEFSATLLGLMGISSGTYLAGKGVSGTGTESASG